MMFRPIRQLADRFNILQMGIVGSERVFKVLDTDEKISETGKFSIDKIQGAISFNAVNFRYNKDEWVLNDLSFDIEGGKMLALVGRTGAGKTSIVSVLNRFYEIDSGNVMIDNININDISLYSLRNNIALVQQEVFLFSDSILNNITLFDDKISRERVIQAANEIGIDVFVNSLPGGEALCSGRERSYFIGEKATNCIFKSLCA